MYVSQKDTCSEQNMDGQQNIHYKDAEIALGFLQTVITAISI
jgi:hypothetical protein